MILDRAAVLERYPDAAKALRGLPDDPVVLRRFVELLEDETPPMYAQMVAARSGPRIGTESSYASSDRFGTLRKQFGGDDRVLERRVAAWRRKGVEVTGNEVWLDFLAKSPDDVEALARPGEVKATIKRLAERNNMTVEGAVKHTARETPPPEDRPRLAPDLVTEIARREAKKDPSFLETPEKKREKYHEIVEKHAYRTPK